MNKLDEQYIDLLKDILENGTSKMDRTGTGTLSVFGRQIRHSMKDGFPLLTTKKMAFKTMVVELLWFLRGDTNIKYLVDNDCHIWDGDAYKRYHTTMNSDDYIENWVEPGEKRDEARKNKGNNGYTKEQFINEIKTDDEFAKTWGELGKIYGKQWRSWYNDNFYKHMTSYDRNSNEPQIEHKVKHIDQIANLINELKTNPDSRRMMVSAWAVHDLRYLLENNCHIWNEDAYKRYENSYAAWVGNSSWSNNGEPWDMENFIRLIKTDERFCSMFGDLGSIYGAQWRNWNGRQTDGFVEYENNGYNEHIKGIDQIQNLINELKTNPDSRRLMVSAWAVHDLPNMVLPPCHYGFQVWTRELSFDERHLLYCKSFMNTNDIHKGSSNVDAMTEYHNNRNIPKRAISLMFNARSQDVPLGTPFNLASYGLLLQLIANEVNMVPDELIGNLGDCHIYLNQIEGVKEQIGRELTDEERYDIWFTNNYETGMERFFNPEKLPDFENSYYTPTPKRTRESFKLPYVSFLDEYHYLNDKELVGDLSFGEKIQEFRPDMFILKDYQSHPKIVLPLSN